MLQNQRFLERMLLSLEGIHREFPIFPHRPKLHIHPQVSQVSVFINQKETWKTETTNKHTEKIESWREITNLRNPWSCVVNVPNFIGFDFSILKQHI